MLQDCKQLALHSVCYAQLHQTCRSATVKAFVDEEPGVGAEVAFSVRKTNTAKMVVNEEAPPLLEVVSLSRTSSACLSNEAGSGLAIASS